VREGIGADEDIDFLADFWGQVEESEGLERHFIYWDVVRVRSQYWE